MGLLDKLFKRGNDESGEDLPVTLDVKARKAQLLQLEQACDNLARAMRAKESHLDAPGWRERINEYSRAAGDAMLLRRGEIDRERLLDLSFEIRPVYSGTAPAGLDDLGPLQDEVVRSAKAIGELLPGERQG